MTSLYELKMLVLMVLESVVLGLASESCGAYATYKMCMGGSPCLGMAYVADGADPMASCGEIAGTAGELGRGKLMPVCASAGS